MQRGTELRVAGALALASIGLTGFQVGLMRLFSYVQWYHFAYMMVSLALLGFGASGAALVWLRPRWQSRPEAFARSLMAVSGLAMPAMVALLAWDPLRFDLYLIFADTLHLLRFATACLLLFVPFLAGAMAVGMLLAAHAKRADRMYFADLLGTGFGGAFGLALATHFLPGSLPALCGLPLLGGAALLSRRRGLVVVVGATALLLAAALFPPAWEPSQFKDLSRTLAMPQAEIKAVETSVQGVVHTVDAPTLHTAPGLSLNYFASIPRGPSFFVDGSFYGMLQPAVEPREPVWEEATTEALPYWVRPDPERVLLLGVGGGSPLRLARHAGAGSVKAVDPHAEIVETVAGGWTGTDNLDFEILSPRVYLERSDETYDLIRFPTIGNFHGGVGLHSLGADFLLTREAISQAWSRLRPGGAIAVTVWLDFPERNPPRLLNLLVHAARGQGLAEPERHLVVVRGWGALTFVLLRQPLGPEGAERILARCERWSFDPLWLGGRELPDRERFHALESRTLFTLSDAILTGEAETVEAYPFALEPPTDRQPFFSQFLEPGSLGAMREAFAARSLPFFELGSFILLLTLALLAVFAALFVLLPLPWLGRTARQTPGGHGRLGGVLFYFGALGLGFLSVEIVLMQIFHLVWGDPILAAGGTISGMLFFSGLGSLLSGLLPARARSLRLTAGLVAGLLVLAAITILPAARALTPLPPILAYPASLVLLALVSLPMGMLFPLGLRLLAERPGVLPWAWGVNGALSVVSSPLALLGSVTLGFPAVLLGAALCYAIAVLSAGRLEIAATESGT